MRWRLHHRRQSPRRPASRARSGRRGSRFAGAATCVDTGARLEHISTLGTQRPGIPPGRSRRLRAAPMLLSFERPAPARAGPLARLPGGGGLVVFLEGGRAARAYLENCIAVVGVLSKKFGEKTREQGHTVDALAPRADEGRGRLR